MSLFDGRGLTGNSTFVFTTTQSDSHNGNDEWIFTDGGVVGTVMKFSASEGITSGTSQGGGGSTESEQQASPVPEPGSATLLVAGCALLAAGRGRRRRL